jgi:hypothetical protein
MFCRAVSKVLISMMVCTSFASRGLANNEKAEAPKEAEKEAGKGAGKGAGKEKAEGAEGGKEELSGSQKKQADEATELQAKVQALEAKVRTKDENIRKLIEEKNETKDPKKVEEIIGQMVVEHKEMNKLIQEYEQNRSLLRYRYPEKGLHGVRTYERMETKPLDQMENQFGIEAKLNRNLKTLHSQYGTATPDSKKKGKKKSDSSVPSLTEPIVIQK